MITGHYLEVGSEHGALAYDHIQSLDEQMHVQPREVFRFLLEVFLQLHELLSVTTLLGVQYRPDSRNISKTNY